MNRVYNFSAGPAMLPEAVLKKVQQEMLNWQGQGASVMELSHRGHPFMALAKQAEADLRELMNIPDNYKVLFLQGGATAQFSAIPLNLLGDSVANKSADYVITGHWGVKAAKDARRFCSVNEVVNTSDSKFTSFPSPSEWKLNEDASYIHITTNETIAGVESYDLPETDKPVVADMSSTIMSREFDVSKYGVIYAGAQKNIGPAGLTIVIVRDDLIGNAASITPRLMDWQVMAESDSMSNTPPTFAWYLSALVFDYLKKQGGISAIEEINARKAARLYDYIDSSGGYYTNPVDVAVRSRMNVPFILKNSDLDAKFLAESYTVGLHSLQGHRSVGGMRASIYNAMPEAGIYRLIDFMVGFKRSNS